MRPRQLSWAEPTGLLGCCREVTKLYCHLKMPPSCLVEFSMTLPHGHSKPSCSCTLSFSFSHLVAFPFPRTPRRITPYSNISHHCWLRLPLEVWDTAITTSLCPTCGHKPHPDSSEDTRGQAVTFNKVSLKFEDNGKGTWPPTNWQQQCMPSST